MRKVKHIYISPSSVEEIKSCQRKFALGRLFGLQTLEPRDKTSADLGANIHKYLEEVAKGVPPTTTDPVVQSFGQRYCAFYNFPNAETIIHSELKLEAPLTERITFRGVIDKVIERDGKLLLCDYKTSKSVRTWVAPLATFSDQVTAYYWLSQMNNFHMDDFILDGIDVSKLAEKEDRVFTRYSAPRTKSQVEEWRERMILEINDIISAIERDSFKAANNSECTKYGTGCEFKSICEVVPESRQRVIKNMFSTVEKTWVDVNVIFE